MPGDLPAVLDEAVVREVVYSVSVEEPALTDALCAVQDVVSSFGNLTVDDLVYEWRSQHHKDSLVSNTPDAYYLDVREHVWDDIFERAELREDLRNPVRQVHAAQFAATLDVEAPDGAMILMRQ